MRFIECLERWCTINELNELMAGMIFIDSREKFYTHFVELRGVDAGQELL